MMTESDKQIGPRKRRRSANRALNALLEVMPRWHRFAGLYEEFLEAASSDYGGPAPAELRDIDASLRRFDDALRPWASAFN